MRDLDTDTLAELEEDQLQIALLCELDFIGGKEYIWAGPEGHSLEWDGNTYTSLADLGEIDRISEAQGMADSRTVVSLRLNSDNISGPIGSDDSRGREAAMILLLLSSSGAPIGEIRFRKKMGRLSLSASVRVDGPSRQVDEKLSLELLDETETLGRTEFSRMTYESGLRTDSTDNFLEFAGDPSASRPTGGLIDGRRFVLPDGTVFDVDEFLRNWRPPL